MAASDADRGPGRDPEHRARPLRWVWIAVGLVCVAIGGVGVLIPGLPTTVFFIAAAGCFARSSRRLERWVLRLPGVGRMVRDYRDGLGMPVRAKVAAVAAITGAAGLSAALAFDTLLPRVVVIGAAVVGIAVIVVGVNTRETAPRQRRQEAEHGPHRRR